MADKINPRLIIAQIVSGVIFIILLFDLASSLVPEAQQAGNTLNATGVPLGTLFAESGVILILIMVGFIIAVFKALKFLLRKNK